MPHIIPSHGSSPRWTQYFFFSSVVCFLFSPPPIWLWTVRWIGEYRVLRTTGEKHAILPVDPDKTQLHGCLSILIHTTESRALGSLLWRAAHARLGRRPILVQTTGILRQPDVSSCSSHIRCVFCWLCMEAAVALFH